MYCMSSWEEIADEVAPRSTRPRGLATGAHRRMAQVCAPSAPRIIAPPPFPPGANLQTALRGAGRAGAAGEYFHICHAARNFDSGFDDLSTLLARATEYLASKTKDGASPRDLLFFDIETTGLSSGTPLFLIGAMHQGQNEAQLDLFLARDFSEERAAIAAFLELVGDRTLVSFNGISFDWPYIEARSRHFGLKFERPRGHFDLLHHARRHWRPLVPNCKLQTLEFYLCGRRREGDIPSAQIPAQYRRFVKTHSEWNSSAHLLVPVVHHNSWDVLTMADLLARFEQRGGYGDD